MSRHSHNINYLFLFSILFPLLFSCNRQSQSGTWDEENATFFIPYAGIGYKLTSDVENWAIAPVENLPDGMKFCGVETSSRACIMLIALSKDEYHAETIDQLTKANIDHFINKITEQPDIDQVRVDSTLVIDSFNRVNGKYFIKDICLNDSVRDIKDLYISYRGNIFDTKGGIYSIVVTLPTDPTDKSDTYLNGLINE